MHVLQNVLFLPGLTLRGNAPSGAVEPLPSAPTIARRHFSGTDYARLSDCTRQSWLMFLSHNYKVRERIAVRELAIFRYAKSLTLMAVL